MELIAVCSDFMAALHALHSSASAAVVFTVVAPEVKVVAAAQRARQDVDFFQLTHFILILSHVVFSFLFAVCAANYTKISRIC